ncbi:Uncharacterised protein [Mycobacteroides abscessus subsp. abscessus]|nr:Uncharacterised protein [Mycobacteroides abscessus subsp. abscessus]
MLQNCTGMPCNFIGRLFNKVFIAQFLPDFFNGTEFKIIDQ